MGVAPSSSLLPCMGTGGGEGSSLLLCVSGLRAGRGKGGGGDIGVGVVSRSSLFPSVYPRGGENNGVGVALESSLLASMSMIAAASGAWLSRGAVCFRHCTVSLTLLFGLGGMGGGDLTVVVGSFRASGTSSANPSAWGMEKLLERLCLGDSSECSGGLLSPYPSRLSSTCNVSVGGADSGTLGPLGGSSSGGMESVRGCLLIRFRLAPASEPLPSLKLQPFTASMLLYAGRLLL